MDVYDLKGWLFGIEDQVESAVNIGMTFFWRVGGGGD